MDEIYKARAVAIDIMDGKVIGNAATSEYFKMPERRTGRISPTQSSYFKNVIEDNPNVKWTFLFMHKPVWMREDGEGLSSIEKQLKDQPYTVFNGHFHTYSHTLDHEQDYIMLGTTGGSQNDQSDMAFDHFTIVTMTKDGPSIANLRLDGVLDKIGKIPGVTETMCFQSSKCKEDTTSHSKKDK